MAATIANGQVYVLLNTATIRVLDVQQSNPPDGTPVLNWQAHLDARPEKQLWLAQEVSGQSGWFFLVNIATKKVLDEYASETSPGTKLISYTQHGGDPDNNQVWQFVPANDHTASTPSWYIQNQSSKMFVTIADGTVPDVNYQVSAWDKDAQPGAQQQWIASHERQLSDPSQQLFRASPSLQGSIDTAKGR